MDKIIKQAQRASRNVLRRKKRDEVHLQKAKEAKGRAGISQFKAAQNELIREAKLRRREDWELGPLAPRRDLGATDETLWGTAPNPAILGRDLYVSPKKQKWMPFVVGDRLVIIRGHDKGKIGHVTSVSKEGQTVAMQGLFQYELHRPDWMRKHEGSDQPSSAYTANIPVSNVRLVLPIIDTATGVVKDTIIDRVEERKLSGGKSDRVVPGLAIAIPSLPEPKPAQEDYDDDTLRITVDEETFTPPLLGPPMPNSVIDELRNKYSRMRTRHEPEFIAKVEQQALGEQDRIDSVKEMETPLKELQRKLREDTAKASSEDARRERGELVGDDLLARLGQLMLEKRSASRASIQDSSQTQHRSAIIPPQVPPEAELNPRPDGP